ncbi:CDP-alcohol phosphatidyltransferase family protein [Labrys sp. ZIDIC5]|uniref:CDP-alcohol phosphatidyltransferase family protein n=1 Tax=Labrys sedimenti TaxID=3106036 RepID=UPI002ACAD137|nr:CDP-alcohol phosphatidyltransferase family protein [Labrys sp. ZIDIC5]MDZ5449921.1 CDP-alcohol phosphatidyltransferase family protein [Labrys sp. ZIDIC5]
MSLYALKPRFQALLRPRVTRLAERGTTANQVTLAAAAGSLVVGLGVAWLSDLRILFLLLPVWLAIRMALNAIDGMLAREFGQKSLLGAYLNEIADVVSDAALILPFATLPVFGPFWTGAVIVLAVISEFAGVMGPMVGANRRYDGPLGKSDRAFVFGALGLWVGLGLPLPGWFGWLMPLAVLFLTLTIVNRVHKGLREARAKQADDGRSHDASL